MTRTADQIALLRTETAPALLKELQGLQAGNEELRAGLVTAISQGLSETREEVRRVLNRDQRELAQARQEVDALRRELGEAQAAWQAELAELKSASVASPAVDKPAVDKNSAQVERADIASSADTRTTELAEETAMSDQSDQSPDIAEQAAADMLTELTTVVGHQVPVPQAATAVAPTPPPTAEQAQASLDAALFKTLMTAARISTAELVCHPHTWQFIASRTTAAEYFQLPSAGGEGKDDMVTVRLPGLSLMATVNALFNTYWEASTGPVRNLQDSAMALAYYTDLSSAIRGTKPADSSAQVDGRPLTRIVIDNRPAQGA
ncbi:hypothetical protein P3T36_006323 [Kitasatospora sp. MAP12-15]|uniref:hypothetical protein n=1 Tax=unclassified Kitasatospora TaxID=2633591 RepID=UPI00247537F0|nr:hypothetical protein [Kitasatospora sp. MAP12-44]MDH6107864.1 hypothetical protein [Kitasatospora sp. MAP12-44]